MTALGCWIPLLLRELCILRQIWQASRAYGLQKTMKCFLEITVVFVLFALWGIGTSNLPTNLTFPKGWTLYYVL
jgi:hypothetical protein